MDVSVSYRIIGYGSKVNRPGEGKIRVNPDFTNSEICNLYFVIQNIRIIFASG